MSDKMDFRVELQGQSQVTRGLRELSSQFAEVGKGSSALREIWQGLEMASRGDISAIFGLAKAFRGLKDAASGVASLGGIAGALMAGWKGGRMLDDMLGISDRLADIFVKPQTEAKKLEGRIKDAVKQAREMESVRLTGLISDIERAGAQTDRFVKGLREFGEWKAQMSDLQQKLQGNGDYAGGQTSRVERIRYLEESRKRIESESKPLGEQLQQVLERQQTYRKQYEESPRSGPQLKVRREIYEAVSSETDVAAKKIMNRLIELDDARKSIERESDRIGKELSVESAAAVREKDAADARTAQEEQARRDKDAKSLADAKIDKNAYLMTQQPLDEQIKRAERNVNATGAELRGEMGPVDDATKARLIAQQIANKERLDALRKRSADETAAKEKAAADEAKRKADEAKRKADQVKQAQSSLTTLRAPQMVGISQEQIFRDYYAKQKGIDPKTKDEKMVDLLQRIAVANEEIVQLSGGVK